VDTWQDTDKTSGPGIKKLGNISRLSTYLPLHSRQQPIPIKINIPLIFRSIPVAYAFVFAATAVSAV